MHKLAIIIPYYKIDHFEDTLKSLAEQRDQRFALYIGNDCSTQDPTALIQQYLSPAQYRYFAYAENLGAENLALQWARILEHVEEPWFQLLGDDDLVSADFVQELNGILDGLADNVNVVKVNSRLCDAAGQTTKQLHGHLKSGFYNAIDLLIQKFKGRLNSSLSEHVFRLSKYKNVGFDNYPLAWHTDDMLIGRMTAGEALMFLSGPQVSIRVYEGSTSGASHNLQDKHAATKRFFMDFLKLLHAGRASWRTKRAFLKSLRQHKRALGMAYLQAVYYRSGIVGSAYFQTYLLKLWLRRLASKLTVIGND
jgi:glycosyltransferase involved in cell wall biosynthesis